MPHHRLRQWKNEVDTWKRLLLFIMGENIHLKSSLSEVLMDNIGPDNLEEAELFQNKFIKQDELIRILRNDVAELDSLLFQVSPDEYLPSSHQFKLEHLRTNLVNVEAASMNLILEFHQFLQRHYTQLDRLKI